MSDTESDLGGHLSALISLGVFPFVFSSKLQPYNVEPTIPAWRMFSSDVFGIWQITESDGTGLVSPSLRKTTTSGGSELENLKEAKMIVCYLGQWECYSSEIDLLAKGRNISNNNSSLFAALLSEGELQRGGGCLYHSQQQPVHYHETSGGLIIW